MTSRDRVQLIDDLKLGVDFHLDRVRELTPLAHRFIFGADATAKLAHIVQETEKLIIDNRASLIPPYPVTYIEFVYSVFLEKLGRAPPAEPLSIGKIGYLIEDRNVHVMMSDPEHRGENCLAPITYQLEPGDDMVTNRKGNLIKVNARDPEFTYSKGLLALGSTARMLPRETIEKVGGEFCFTIIVPTHRKDDIKIMPDGTAAVRADIVTNLLRECTGDIRNLFVALTVINQPTSQKMVELQPVPRWAGIIGNNRRVLPSHTTVRINLDGPRPIAASLGLRHHASPALHDVRGCFMHFGLEPSCEHHWREIPNMPDGVRRWVCEGCGGRRSWKREHKRGTDFGRVITHTYVATTTERAESHEQGPSQGAGGDQGSAGDGTRTGRWHSRAPSECDR